MDRHGLKAQQLEQRAHEDIGAGGKDVGPQELEAVRAVPPGHAVKEANRLLQRQLEPARTVLEPGNDEGPDHDRSQQQDRCDQKRGDQAWIYRLQSEKADLIDVMQDGVTHRLLHAL